ncbi:MAG TPA: response regulator [Caulobacteraceae bacterium]|nr:response regulator [Caulobacteraceae bacterium]
MTDRLQACARLAGLRLLIAEDDGLLGMHLEDQLRDAGCEVVGFATSLKQAVDLARSSATDGAVLDINLGGEMVYEAAEALRDRGIPFVFLTGYEGMTIPPSFRGRPVVQKPFRFDDLARLMSAWRK